MMMRETTYRRMLALAQRLSRQLRVSPESVFEPVGLILHTPPERWDYFCTPLNSLTFASTGGDGVHFGRLLGGGGASGPVVMTVPMADEKNLVVGESLHEFLCLGVGRGYFYLEQLAYDREAAVAMLSGETDGEAGGAEIYLVDALRAEFGLRPWAGIGDRLRALEQKYAPALEVLDFE
jgi:hypothetical protein